MKAPLPYRIVIDSSCIKSLYTYLGKDSFSKFLYDLMYINTNSLEHKKNHIISSKDGVEVIKKYLIDKIDEIQQAWLEACIRPQSEKDVEDNYTNEIEKNWEYAVKKSYENPHQTIIFTDKSNKPKYCELKEKDTKDNINMVSNEHSINERIKMFVDLCKKYKAN